jgi:hypothetical protein
LGSFDSIEGYQMARVEDGLETTHEDHVAFYRRRLAKGVGRTPTALLKLQIVTTARLCAEEERALADPDVPADTKVRIVGASRRARLDLQSMVDAAKPKRRVQNRNVEIRQEDSMAFQDIAEIAPDTILTFREWCEVIGVGGEQDRVWTHKEWTKAAGISEKNGRELIERGDGPLTVQLSPNRIGVRVCDYRKWLAARVRKVT